MTTRRFQPGRRCDLMHAGLPTPTSLVRPTREERQR